LVDAVNGLEKMKTGLKMNENWTENERNMDAFFDGEIAWLKCT